MPKISEYFKTFIVKDGDKDKNINLLSFHIDGQKLLEKYKAIWTKFKDFKNIELNTLPIYGDRYVKTKIRTYGSKVYTNFPGLNILEDEIECKSFTFISIDSFLAYENKYYLQVYLDNCAYKITNRQMTNYFDDNLFED